MTTARPAVPQAGTRRQRRIARRRIAREELLAAVVLLVAFLVTVLLLGMQWLDTGSSGSAASPAALHPTTLEVA